MIRRIRNARADVAVLIDIPALDAMLLRVSRPNAVSSCDALAVGAPPLSYEDTMSPMPLAQ
jgi:hypothetical protein